MYFKSFATFVSQLVETLREFIKVGKKNDEVLALALVSNLWKSNFYIFLFQFLYLVICSFNTVMHIATFQSFWQFETYNLKFLVGAKENAKIENQNYKSRFL